MSGTDKTYVSIEEVISIPALREIAVHPDGSAVAYVKRVANWDDNIYVDHVQIFEKTSGRHVSLTSGNVASSAPMWSPDGKKLAYLQAGPEGDAKKQIYLYTMETATSLRVTRAVNDVKSFRWAPDGSGLYYISELAASGKQKERKRLYGDFEYVNIDDNKSTLYFCPINPALARTLGPLQGPSDVRQDVLSDEELAICLIEMADVHVSAFDVSRDGEKIVVAIAPSSRITDVEKTEFHLLDVATRHMTPLPIPKPVYYDVHFSPDGRKICYTKRPPDNAYYDTDVLESYDLETKKCERLTGDLDESVYPVAWIKSGIVIEWQDKTSRKIELVKADGSRELVAGGDGHLAYGASVSADGEQIAYLKASDTELADVFLNGERVTNRNQHYEGRAKSTKRVIEWESGDGTAIEGILSIPPDFDQSKRYPLLVVIHGGPVAASFAVPTSNLYYPIESFIECGFIVLEPNYRGSAGYGSKFRRLNVRNLGIGDYSDVIAGVDHLVSQGFADASRVGVMGWSQGGYISAFCSTYSNRFKAVSVGAGISNWATYYVSTDIHPFTRHYLAATPWEDEVIYKRTSPITYVNEASTPTLIQHGDNDSRVPVQNAYELYQGLSDVGVDANLIIFKGMGHGADKPGLHRAIQKQNLAWFCNHILGAPLDGFWL
ncbi:S9 family peptidase [Alicyclobacillus dauci]|uniref:S9 family peptidase n=1 Tax=Alicyclobacillus dauci TaxID=1475485 RepID=A0ABY6Z1D6_9BACL|nr:S9 family peptidase [Alicyclobacillus dauci]WAH36134.1 S9 family peptidase [Alicyclobacillus dauci]